MGKKAIWGVAAAVLLALVVVALMVAWPRLFPRAVVEAPRDPRCDLRAGPCELAIPGGGRVRFAIEPRTLPLMQPLSLSVEVEGLEASQVEVDFAGIGMNMGFNRPVLMADGPGRFRGETRLPVCIRKAMEWEARVLLESDRGLVSAPFRFITVKSGALSEGGGG